jgi:hypothetical protein
MALGSTMLQLVVDQQLAQDVSTVAPLFAEVFELLSLGTVTVREISMERLGGVYGDSSAFPLEATTTGFAMLLLFTEDGGEQMFLAPSYVLSPPFGNALAAILQVRDGGFNSGATNLQVARRLGAHAYLDEV